MCTKLRSVEVSRVTYDKQGVGTTHVNVYKFHAWGSEGLEGEDGSVASQTVAIVEDCNGKIETVYPHQLRFITWRNR